MKPTTTDVNDRWLTPSAALNRYKPPEGVAIGMHPPTAVRHARFGFRVGQLRFLINPDTHSEVIIHIPIAPLPSVPVWFMGVMNLRGNLLPVFDLHQLLDVGERGRNKQTVLVLDQGSDMVGVAIDGLPESVTPDLALRSLPPLHEALQEHVSAAYTTDDTIWLDFDHQGFFTTLGRQVTS